MALHTPKSDRALIEKATGVSTSKTKIPDHSPTWNWTPELFAAISRATSPDSPANPNPHSAAFTSALITFLCDQCSAGSYPYNFSAHPEAISITLTAIGNIPALLPQTKTTSSLSNGDPATPASALICKLANKCSRNLSEIAGAGMRSTHNSESFISPTLQILHLLLPMVPRAVLVSNAKRFIPPWQLDQPEASFQNIQACTQFYELAFPLGVQIQDIFETGIQPGVSIAQQLSDRIGLIKAPSIAGLFRSQLEKQLLHISSSPSSEQIKAPLLAVGASEAKMTELLNLITLLDGPTPGSGIDTAIAMLKTHPNIPQPTGPSTTKNTARPSPRI